MFSARQNKSGVARVEIKPQLVASAHQMRSVYKLCHPVARAAHLRFKQCFDELEFDAVVGTQKLDCRFAVLAVRIQSVLQTHPAIGQPVHFQTPATEIEKAAVGVGRYDGLFALDVTVRRRIAFRATDIRRFGKLAVGNVSKSRRIIKSENAVFFNQKRIGQRMPLLSPFSQGIVYPRTGRGFEKFFKSLLSVT